MTPAIVARAQYWNPKLWNYATASIRTPFAQEQLGGRWLTFSAAKHPNPGGSWPSTANPWLMATEVYRLTDAPPAGYGAGHAAAKYVHPLPGPRMTLKPNK